MQKGVLFDMDGVLVNTNGIHYEAWKEICRKYGIPFDGEIFVKQLLGRSRPDQLEYLISSAGMSFSAEEKNKIMNEKNELAVRSLSLLSAADVDPDIFFTLEKLKEKGIKMAVASSSANSPMIIRNTGIIAYLDYMVDATMVKRAKPAGDIYVNAAAGLGLKPEECLVIEDAISGVNAAIAAGIESCGLSDAYYYEGTTYPIRKVSDLLRHV